MSEIRLIDANALKAKLPEPTTIKQDWVYRTLCDFIDNAPTVEPFEKIGAICNENCGYKPKPQGRWIYTDKEDKKKGYGGYCSVCKCDMPIGMIDWKQKYYESKFCPNCGADMRKPNCVTCDHFGKCEGCEKGEEE